MAARSMILAAGKGTRMGALSETLPKPLVPVAGKAMIDRTLAKIKQAGFGPTVVNVHHLADQMETHLADSVKDGSVVISDEREQLLETGGGVAKARPLLEDGSVLVINGDAVWTDGAQNTLTRLARAFDPERMDILLLAVPTGLASGYDGSGDLVLGTGCRSEACLARLRGEAPRADHMYGGVMMVRAALYDGRSISAPWSNTVLFREAEAKGRLFGIEHRGNWMHVGTPEGLVQAEDILGRLAEISGADQER